MSSQSGPSGQRPWPTPYAELNDVLGRLVAQAQAILGENFVGAYLQGSFAAGDFDEHSDVDFLVVVEDGPTAAQEAALQAMHEAIFALATPWAQHLEGSYVPRPAIRYGDPARQPWLYIDNGSRALERSDHDNTLVVRWTLRERGIALAGPAPQDLIAPVPPDELREEVRATMREWGAQLLADPAQMNNRWYQPFAVLSYCRMLQTLETGTIESKPAGASWAQRALDPRWAGLIQRAWEQRPDPSQQVRQKADPADLAMSVEFITYAIGLIDEGR
jgi:predicted nucleotidyltransferase